MVAFVWEIVAGGTDLDDGVTEEGGEHGDGADGEVVLSAEPFGDFAWFATEGISKLLLGEASLLHESVDFVGNGEGEVYLGLDVVWDVGDHLLEGIVDGFHDLGVFMGIDD